MKFWRWTAFFALACGLAACRATVDLRYRPYGEVPPLPGAEGLRLYVAPVADRSGGVKLSGDAMSFSFSHPRPPAEAIREALETQMQGLGFSVVSSAGQADAVLQAAATILSLDVAVSGASAITRARLQLMLSLKGRAGAAPWSGIVEGRAKGSRAGGYSPAEFDLYLNRALSDAMANIGPRWAAEEALEKIAPSKEPERVAAAAVEQAPQPAAAPAPAEAVSDADFPPAAAAEPKPQAFAVVIGIGKYRGGLPPADYADRDARAVAKYLKALGYPDANVAALVNEEATKGDLEKYLERWLPNHVAEGGEVFVYYSGHGAPDPASGESFLVPYDGDPVYLKETAYPVKKLYAELAKLPASTVTVVLDSCFSGAGGRSVLAQGARPLVTLAPLDVPAKLTVIAASSGEQISHSYAQQRHGLFTYYFLKGLKQRGADLRAAFDYLKPQVAAYARRELNADQEPQWRQGP